MNKEGQNGATVILPRQLTCWPTLRTADDLKKDTHKSVYRAEINLITLIPDAASLEENSVCESMSSFRITSDGVSRLLMIYAPSLHLHNMVNYVKVAQHLRLVTRHVEALIPCTVLKSRAQPKKIAFKQSISQIPINTQLQHGPSFFKLASHGMIN